MLTNHPLSLPQVTISLEYLCHFLSAIGQSKNEITALLTRLDISDIDNVQTRLDIQQAAQFLAEVSIHLDIQNLGLVAGLNMHPSQWGDIGHLMICSRTLSEALNHAIENEDILNSAIDTQLHFKEGWVEHAVTMPILDDDELAKPFIERDFTALLQSAGFLLNKAPLDAVKVKAISFRHQAPTDANQVELYLQTFGCMPSFSTNSNTMVYHSDVLQAEIPSANPQLQSMLLQQIERTRQDNNISHSLSDRVQTLLKNESLQNLPDQKETAAKLGMSISTLKRRLQQENTNFKQLFNQLRCSQAQQLLTNSETNLTEISLLLGFASASAFNNAFKKWVGVTPLNYRQQQQGLKSFPDQ